jgi:hypothetical protein
MMKYAKILALASALILTAGVALASRSSGTNSTKQTSQSATHTKSTSVTHHRMGTVSSLTANELILDYTWKGKEHKTNFTLDSETKKEGNIAQGDRITVYYHFEKGQRVATEIKVSENKTPSGTKKS